LLSNVEKREPKKGQKAHKKVMLTFYLFLHRLESWKVSAGHSIVICRPDKKYLGELS
jgi:hypothetical protein